MYNAGQHYTMFWTIAMQVYIVKKCTYGPKQHKFRIFLTILCHNAYFIKKGQQLHLSFQNILIILAFKRLSKFVDLSLLKKNLNSSSQTSGLDHLLGLQTSKRGRKIWWKGFVKSYHLQITFLCDFLVNLCKLRVAW